jgi:hypothetical protein
VEVFGGSNLYLSRLILFIEGVEAQVGAGHARYPFPLGFNGAVAGVAMYSSFSFLGWNSVPFVF